MSGEVALVSMPTVSAAYPSYQLALLRPLLERAGIPTRVYSLFLYFGRHVGWGINEELGAVRACMIGEWIWAPEAFGQDRDVEVYLEEHASEIEIVCRRADCSREDLLRVRRELTSTFLDFCLESIDWSRFGLIGFSVVYQQMLASLALARRLKERHPEIPIAFGGAAFEDDIAGEIARNCPQVDLVHCGDGEKSVPDLARRILRGESVVGRPGIVTRDGSGISFAGRTPNTENLEAIPTPDYDEYFYARRESGYVDEEDRERVLLPIETGRGCWWGQRKHCIFCGLNRAGVDFRHRGGEATLAMLEELTRRYGTHCFYAIDNIMPREFGQELFGRLAEDRCDLWLHYNTRPDLDHATLRALSSGGLRSIQPGVESLSTRLLRKLGKGVTAVRNLELLKWARYYRIQNVYNLLYRIPGETADDYREQCELIRRIPHLQPPWTAGDVRADRGSPMFLRPEGHGVRNLRPAPCYRHLYPPGRFDLRRVAYFLDHDLEGALSEGGYDDYLRRIGKWQARWEEEPRPSLVYAKRPGSLRIADRRHGEVRRTVLVDEEARIYGTCDDAATTKQVVERTGLGEARVVETLRKFEDWDLMVHLDGRHLSLALPSNLDN